MKKLLPLLCCLAAPLVPAAAQDAALVEALAPLLMLEDRREFNPGVFAEALEHPEPLVRRTAVVALGRIGRPEARTLLVPRLHDPELAVVADVFFAFGLLRDTLSVQPILERLRAGDTLDAGALSEAAIALVKIGGPVAVGAIRDLIGGVGGAVSRERRDAMLLPAMLESWRLGANAPTDALLPFAIDENTDRRWRALYVLGRLNAPRAGEVMLRAIRDRVGLIRETAAKSLTRRFVDSTGLGSDGVVAELRRALDDAEAGVRISALGALTTYRDSLQAEVVTSLLLDPDRNVRVAAAGTLGGLGGSEAVTALEGVFAMRDAGWALERAALGALAQTDTAAFHRHVGRWLESADPLSRAAALQLIGTARPSTSAQFKTGLTDRDPRVRAAALGAWASSGPAHRADAAEAARAALGDAESLVKAAAVGALDPVATPTDLDLLAERWRGADNEVRAAILQKLGAVGRAQPDLVASLAAPTRRILLERPADPWLRGIGHRSVPALATRWGPATPMETGKTLEDYRGIVRSLVLARENPKVTIEVDGRGTIEIELLAREAPLTVANFLQLADRRYFDGNRWHRVVPNFVVQDGDRTGLGSGGPGWSIRDEINRRQYDIPMVGMALSGPDTGGSQWFINLSPQPHLNGQYTIFGRVVGSYTPLRRVLQGDVIRTIRR